ncbi:MAG: hypothetical protein ACOX05_02945 [Bacillota bacterium]|jgi:hypothetical protein
MSDRQKEILFKALLLIGLASLFVGAFMVDPGWHSDPNEWFYLGLVLLLLGFIFAGMCFLMPLNFKVGKYYGEKHILTAKNFEMFQARLEEDLYDQDFEKSEEFLGQNYKMTLYYKEDLNNFYTFALVKTEELTEDIYESYLNKYNEYIEGTNWSVGFKNIHLIHCVCVQRINKTFREFLYEEIENYVGRYQLPIGISFGGRGLYIPVQKGTLFPGKYKKLKKLFMSLVENQLKPGEAEIEAEKK